MEHLPALVVAVPLAAAAVVAGAGHLVPRRVREAAALAAAAATAGLAVLLLRSAAREVRVYWFGGWEPIEGLAVGVAFVADPVAAALTVAAGLTTTAALLYSWHYYEDVRGLYHALVLVFLAGMNGVALTGDLFNLFVFLELLSVAAFALTAVKIEAPSLSGSFAFAIVNSVGALFLVSGAGLLYGHTGRLNFADVGRAVAMEAPGALLVAAFVLIATGLLVKAAIVPFHFWLSDAYAVAPVPVAALFAGVMLELGLYALARVYATVFAEPFAAGEGRVRAVLLAAGAASAVLGPLMALRQRHLKRMLAFVTIGHAGILLVGLGLLHAKALAGAWIYLVTDGAARSALFFACGLLLHRYGSVDTVELRGRARGSYGTAALFVLGAVALAAPPWTGTGLGKALIEESAHAHHRDWIPWLLTAASGLTAAAVLRASGKVFAGWGGGRDPDEASPAPEETREMVGDGKRPSATMGLAPAALLLLAFAPGWLPGLHRAAEEAARWFLEPRRYGEAVLDGATAIDFGPLPPGLGFTPLSLGLGLLGLALAFAAAAVLFLWGSLPERFRARPEQVVRALYAGLERLHSHRPGDYLAWILVGCALLALALWPLAA